jgi:hypothetical protein
MAGWVILYFRITNNIVDMEDDFSYYSGGVKHFLRRDRSIYCADNEYGNDYRTPDSF